MSQPAFQTKTLQWDSKKHCNVSIKINTQQSVYKQLLTCILQLVKYWTQMIKIGHLRHQTTILCKPCSTKLDNKVQLAAFRSY